MANPKQTQARENELRYRGARLRDELKDAAALHPEIFHKEGLSQIIQAWEAIERESVEHLCAPPAGRERERGLRNQVIAELTGDKLHEIMEHHSTDVIDYENAADDIMAAICGGVGPFAALAIAGADEPGQREQLAKWMIENSFATGHGETHADLLRELKWQIEEIRAAQPEGESK